MRFPYDVPTLVDGNITLRAHHEDDLPAVVEQCTDPDTIRWTSIPSPYSLDDAKRHLRQTVPAGWDSETEFSFAIDQAGRYAGACTVRVLPDRRGDVGYVVHPAHRGRGVMERALRLLVDWAFDTRRFETLVWWAHLGNWASRRVSWKLGFSCVGPLGHWLPQRGNLNDCWVGVLGADEPRHPRHPWYDAPTILANGLMLRHQVDADAPAIAEACSDARTRAWLRLPSPYGRREAMAFIESRREAMATGTCVHWAIADPGDDALLGVVNLFDIEQEVDAEVGFWTHPQARGRGVMTRACGLAVRHAFVPSEDGGLGLTRVRAAAGVGNTASRHVIEANGFTPYGVERRGLTLGDGTRSDLVWYDLLLQEWAQSDPSPPSPSMTTT